MVIPILLLAILFSVIVSLFNQIGIKLFFACFAINSSTAKSAKILRKGRRELQSIYNSFNSAFKQNNIKVN
jgi:hypothetical protein